MILSRVQQAANGAGHSLFGASTTLYSTRVVIPSRQQADVEAVISRYQALNAYRVSNRLYDSLNEMLASVDLPVKTIAGFRNPTNAVVEFYCATVMPGSNLRDALPIEVALNPKRQGTPQAEQERTERLEDAAYQILVWSNWAMQKQRYIRGLSTYGDAFLKVVTRSDERGVRRVFFRILRPEDVTDFDVDERGFLTYIRIDIPQIERQQDGSLREWMHVEVWDKRLGTYRVWELPKDQANKETERLGPAREDRAITDLTGGDFLPFVHTKFMDDGDLRGMAPIEPALDKIDELNAMVTRLHRRLFLYGTAMEQMVSGVLDPDGMPMAAPADADSDLLSMADGDIVKLPSGWRLEPRNSNAEKSWQAQIDAIEAMEKHLQQTDLPELGWGRVGDTTRELAGIALRIMLAPALAKVIEVRGNAEAGLVRAIQMGLTLAQNGELDGFSEAEIGTWDNGDFEFGFKEREVVALTESEDASIELQRAQAAEKKSAVGWSNEQIQREFGLSAEEISQMQTELPTEQRAGALLDAALRRGDGQA